MKPLIGDLPPRRINLYQPRKRRKINWWALIMPSYFLLMIILVGFTINSWRQSADRAVNRWAQKVGVE